MRKWEKQDRKMRSWDVGKPGCWEAEKIRSWEVAKLGGK
jgi:hypothetical protein